MHPGALTSLQGLHIYRLLDIIHIVLFAHRALLPSATTCLKPKASTLLAFTGKPKLPRSSSSINESEHTCALVPVLVFMIDGDSVDDDGGGAEDEDDDGDEDKR
jgi:hypothetical protein